MIKLKENIKFNHTIYDASFGTTRIGDLVAASALCSWLRIYFNKPDILFAMRIEPYVLPIAKEFEEWIILNNGNYPKLPIDGNLWAWWDLLYRDGYRLVVENNYANETPGKKAVVSPVFDAGYNKDRNWNMNCYNDIVKILLQLDYKVTVVMHDLGRIVQRVDVKYIGGNLFKSFVEVATADVLISGDTGFTHIASVLRGKPRKVIGLYGFFSEWRHQNDCRDSITYLDKYIEQPFECNVSFAPKFSLKEGLYLQLSESSMLRESSVDKIIEYLRT